VAEPSPANRLANGAEPAADTAAAATGRTDRPGAPPVEHVRHKPPSSLERPREIVLVCAPLRSNVNLSRMVRTASCCGLSRIIVCGKPKIDREIARDGADQVRLESHRTLPPVLGALKADGYQLVGLEQTTGSVSLYEFRFARRTALVVGNERTGLDDETLRLLDRVVEIPVFGLPYSYNVATSADMALYEYCRQFPAG
jgi:tRNA G18 (ribose-2'-O)-methylase SpoU